MTVIRDVCPRCGNDRPTCADTKPDGSHYSHRDTCATYQWASEVCDPCKPLLDLDAAMMRRG